MNIKKVNNKFYNIFVILSYREQLTQSDVYSEKTECHRVVFLSCTNLESFVFG